MIETILICALFGAFILLSYTLGLKNGQKLSKQEKIELPKPVINIPKVNKKALESDNLDEEKLSIIMANIDNYDGTSKGQVKVK